MIFIEALYILAVLETPENSILSTTILGSSLGSNCGLHNSSSINTSFSGHWCDYRVTAISTSTTDADAECEMLD